MSLIHKVLAFSKNDFLLRYEFGYQGNMYRFVSHSLLQVCVLMSTLEYV